jgi:hypothetical protein
MSEAVSIVPARLVAHEIGEPGESPGAISDYLERAAETCNLISPATSVGVLPEGCRVVLSMVPISTDPADGDVYPVQGGGGRLGLSKFALERIASAAGVSWVPERSGRLDDGSDPHYCLFRVVGRYYHFDGREQVISGVKEIDLREGSAQLELLRAGARSADRAAQQVLVLRANIVGHAETKAKLRAIRSMGIKSGYFPRELEKPFVVARLSFTGQTEDAALRRRFSVMRLRSLMGHGAMAGPDVLNPKRVRAGGATGVRPRLVASEVERSPEEPEGVPEARAPSSPAGLLLPHEEVPCIRFGPARGTPVTEADDSTLAWYAGVLERYLSQPNNTDFRAYNERVLEMVREQQARRQWGAA